MDFAFKEDLSELRGSEFGETTVYKNVNTLEDELFGDKKVKDRILDIEQQLGVRRTVKEPKSKMCNKMLNLGKEADREFLDEILNNPNKYMIRWQKDTWTNFGEFRMFIVYQEFEVAALPATKEKEEERE